MNPIRSNEHLNGVRMLKQNQKRAVRLAKQCYAEDPHDPIWVEIEKGDWFKECEGFFVEKENEFSRPYLKEFLKKKIFFCEHPENYKIFSTQMLTDLRALQDQYLEPISILFFQGNSDNYYSKYHFIDFLMCVYNLESPQSNPIKEKLNLIYVKDKKMKEFSKNIMPIHFDIDVTFEILSVNPQVKSRLLYDGVFNV